MYAKALAHQVYILRAKTSKHSSPVLLVDCPAGMIT